MRVLVVAEGNHELGNAQTIGALSILVTRLIGEEIEIEREPVSSTKVRIHLQRGKSHGFVKRGLAWIRYAERERFDALVFLIDEDGERARIAAVDDCQTNLHFSLRRAMGVAIRTFDAWMLADEKAISSALSHTVHRQSDPETVSDPKSVCAALCAAASISLSATQFYAQVAQVADLEVMSARCPKGFAPFAAHVKALHGA